MQLGRSFFDDYRFEHRGAAPRSTSTEIDTSVEFLGRRLAAPLLISCMTGGTEMAGRINRNLADGAEQTGVAVGVGSQRKALEDPAKADTFRVREVAPTVALLANLGAVQLNYGMGLRECRQAVDMIGADALVLHLNPLQEAIQPEGQRNFSGLLPKIGRVRRARTGGAGGGQGDRLRHLGRDGAGLARRACGSSIPPESAARAGRASRRQRARRPRDRRALRRLGAADAGVDPAGPRVPEGTDAHRQRRPAQRARRRQGAGPRRRPRRLRLPVPGSRPRNPPSGSPSKVRRIVRELKICMFCLGCKNDRGAATYELLKGSVR